MYHADSFSKFDKEIILAMAHLYLDDFQNERKLEELRCQLDNYVKNFHDDSRFSDIKGIGDLCRKLVEKKTYYLSSCVSRPWSEYILQ
jgi:hypothetical protein